MLRLFTLLSALASLNLVLSYTDIPDPFFMTTTLNKKMSDIEQGTNQTQFSLKPYPLYAEVTGSGKTNMLRLDLTFFKVLPLNFIINCSSGQFLLYVPAAKMCLKNKLNLSFNITQGLQLLNKVDNLAGLVSNASTNIKYPLDSKDKNNYTAFAINFTKISGLFYLGEDDTQAYLEVDYVQESIIPKIPGVRIRQKAFSLQLPSAFVAAIEFNAKSPNLTSSTFSF